MSFRTSILVTFLLLAPRVASGDDFKLPFSHPEDYRSLPQTALIETTKGPVEIGFYRKKAPVTVKNFEYLAKKGFYKELSFHLYMEDFIIQGGDPQGTGKGGPGHTLPPELSQVPHLEGTIGMAKKPNPVNPERRSNGSQFYICLNRAKHLDGLYTVFAKVINGIENVRKR